MILENDQLVGTELKNATEFSGTGLQNELADRFEDILKKNPPFVNDSFDPDKEIKNIATLPKEEKRAAVEKFKERRARYKKALSTTFDFLSQSVEDNPDIEKETLLHWVHAFAKVYSFSTEIIQEFISGIEEYLRLRERLKNYMDGFEENPIPLVEKLTGYSIPDEEKHQIQKVELGTFSINIYCNGSTHMAYKLQQSLNPKAKYAPFTSFATKAKNDADIPISVIAAPWPETQTTVLHESQHQEVDFMRKFFYKKPELTIQWTEYVDEKNPDKKRVIIENFMRQSRDIALEKFKNEFFSMIKDRRRYDYKSFFSSQGNSYDYLGYLRHYLTDPLFVSASKKILSDEYYQIIDEAIETFQNVAFRISAKSAMGLFHNIPVKRWKKEAKNIFINDRLFQK